MINVVAAQKSAAPTIMMSPISLARIERGRRQPKATTMPANDKASPSHCAELKRSAGRTMRAPSTTKKGARYMNSVARVAVV